MIFKISPPKEKLYTIIFIAAFIVFFAGVFVLVGSVVGNLAVGYWAVLCFAAPEALMMLEVVKQYQCFEVYKDKIIVKSPFGKVNEVNLNEVQRVLKAKLPYYTRDAGCEHYIFCDGRPIKRRGIMYNINSVNHKKICVRIPISEELDKYVNNKGLEIICKDYSRLYDKVF